MFSRRSSLACLKLASSVACAIRVAVAWSSFSQPFLEGVGGYGIEGRAMSLPRFIPQCSQSRGIFIADNSSLRHLRLHQTGESVPGSQETYFFDFKSVDVLGGLVKSGSPDIYLARLRHPNTQRGFRRSRPTGWNCAICASSRVLISSRCRMCIANRA